MLKIAVVLMELLRRALFKDKDEFNLNSSKFDALKVSIFLYIVLSAVFTVYSIRTIGSNIIEIRNTKDQIKKYISYEECINKQINIKASDIIPRIQNCSPR